MPERRKTEPKRMLKATVRVPEHVVQRSFEAETLLLNLDTGSYHRLNETGGRMLELLEATSGRVEDATAILAEEYGVSHEEITPDLIAFCSDLESRGLIVVVDEPGSAGGEA
jgi:Coenzyme PQQ synthesis protein D (PqqD)